MSGSQQSPCRILVMASGNGSNFQALIDAVASGQIPNSKIIRLIVNRGKAFAKTRAEKAQIPCEYFNLISHGFIPKGEKDETKVKEARQKYDAALAEKIIGSDENQKPELVVLAGWMHVFGQTLLEPLEQAGIRVINLHPALPGEYDGEGAISRAYSDYKAGKTTRTGIMIHEVVLQVDRGAPILTREIEFREGESLEQFEERLHSHEHELIVQATAQVVEGIVSQRK